MVKNVTFKIWGSGWLQLLVTGRERDDATPANLPRAQTLFGGSLRDARK